LIETGRRSAGMVAVEEVVTAVAAAGKPRF
jgi:hypothetical protein